ncbi:MAG: hypothetical protein ABL927_15075, partial [Bdellovibrionales bacterium]
MKTNKSTATQPDVHHSTIAILQTTRFGDLIQTAQAINELKSQYPHYRVVLISRMQFGKPLEFIFRSLVDKFYYLDTKSIFQNESPLTGLNGFLNSIRVESIDVLVNLSFSKSSAYLASLISAQHKVGARIDATNRMCIDDKWSQMLFSTVMRGGLNPFSLVDLFRNIIGLRATATQNTKRSEDKNKNIIIHPFASQERKS